MARNDYRRTLVMLRGLERGVSGHARLEMRERTGAMQLSAYGADAADALHAALLRVKDGIWLAAPLGAFSRDSRGQARLTRAVDPRNIAGQPLDAYAMLGVVAVRNGRARLLLTGFLTGTLSVDWAQARGAACGLYEKKEVVREETPVTDLPEYESAGAEPCTDTAVEETALADVDTERVQSEMEAAADAEPADIDADEARSETEAAMTEIVSERATRETATDAARDDILAKRTARETATDAARGDIASKRVARETATDDILSERATRETATDAAMTDILSKRATRETAANAARDDLVSKRATRGKAADAAAASDILSKRTARETATASIATESETSVTETAGPACCCEEMPLPNTEAQDGTNAAEIAPDASSEEAALSDSAVQGEDLIPIDSYAPEEESILVDFDAQNAEALAEETITSSSARAREEARTDDSEARDAETDSIESDNAVTDETAAELLPSQAMRDSAVIDETAAELLSSQAMRDGAVTDETAAELLSSQAMRDNADFPLDLSVPWPEAAEALRSLFRRSAPFVPYPDDEYVFVKAPLATGGGYDHCAIGVKAARQIPVAICYALPARFTIEPPPGLEGYRWRAAGNGYGYWVIELDAASGDELEDDE